MKKTLFEITIVILLFVVVGALFLPGAVDSYQSKQAAKGVLDHLVTRNYEIAFNHIQYFDVASDLEPTIKFKAAKTKWIQRVTDLEKDGTYLIDYKGLKVKLDDTYPKGSVDLIIMESGKESLRKNVQLFFLPSKEGWKLGGLHFYSEKEDETEEDWERAWSGYVGSDD